MSAYSRRLSRSLWLRSSSLIIVDSPPWLMLSCGRNLSQLPIVRQNKQKVND
jgi:hypothetical protein